MSDAIDTIVKYHREWLERNGTRILERDAAYLREDIEEGSPQAFQQIPDSLNGLATYYGNLGTVALIDGVKSGLQSISTAIDFRGWELKLRAESFFHNIGQRVVNLTNYVSRAACLVCVSEKWEKVAEKILRQIDVNPESVDRAYWKSRRFEPFVLRCSLLRDGAHLSPQSLNEPYQAIVDAWTNTNESALADALEKVCEYHCANMDDAGGVWDPEFKHSPFDLLPCEVMLVRRVRVKFGLSTPSLSHKLVSKLGTLDSITPSSEEHELIESLSRAYERCFS